MTEYHTAFRRHGPPAGMLKPESVELPGAFRHLIGKRTFGHLVTQQIGDAVRFKRQRGRQRAQVIDVLRRHPLTVVMHPFIAVGPPDLLSFPGGPYIQQVPVVVAGNALRVMVDEPLHHLMRESPVIHQVAGTPDGVHLSGVLQHCLQRLYIGMNV